MIVIYTKTAPSVGDYTFSGTPAAKIYVRGSATGFGANWGGKSVARLSEIKYTSYDGKAITPNNTTAFGTDVNFFGSFYDGNEGGKTFGYLFFKGNVTEIPNEAFKEFSSLTSIILPSQVTKVGQEAFRSCARLESVTFESQDNLTEIGSYAFESCEALQSINLPNSLTKIDVHTFYQCTNLSNVELPENLVTIGDAAFGYCQSLTEVTIPSKVTSMGSSGFYYCTNLKSLYMLTKSAPEIKSNIFYKTHSDMKVYVREIASSSFANAARWRSMTRKTLPNIHYTYSDGNAVTPNALSGYGMDGNCLGSFYDGNDGGNTFGYLEFKGDVTKIPNDAFKNNRKLKTIDIPSSVSAIGSSAFWGCSALETINVGASPASLGNYAFSGISSSHVVKVPSINSYATYKSANGWKNLNLRAPSMNLTLNDQTPYTYDVIADDCTLSYTRTVTSDNWMGVCLPFDIVYSHWSAKGEAAILTGAEGKTLDWTILESGAEIAAGTPFIFKPTEFAANERTRNILFSKTAATLHSSTEKHPATFGGYTLYGTFETKDDMKTDHAYALSNNAFRQANNNGQTLKPYRVYIKAGSTAHAPAHIRCRINGEDVTGIEGLTIDPLTIDDCMYNLQGIRVDDSFKGIVIVNGKKVIRK